MKKAKKISIIISLAMIVLGILLCTLTLIPYGFDFQTYSNTQYQKQEKSFEKNSFDHIIIHNISDDIEIKLSKDNQIHLEYTDTNDSLYYEVNLQNRTLSINQNDRNQFFRFDLFQINQNNKLILYLAKEDYESLALETVSGDIDLSDHLQFQQAADISSVSGDISLKNLTISEDQKGSLSVHTTSGDIYLKEVKTNQTELNTISGDIQLQHPDSDLININTVSGDVNGIVNKPYQYRTENFKNVSLPASHQTDAMITFHTISGDISIQES